MNRASFSMSRRGPCKVDSSVSCRCRELDGRYTQRSVEGKSCDGVINALAFVAAVLADPEAAQTVEPTPAELPPPSPPAPRTTPSAPTLGVGVTTGVTTATSHAPLQPNVGLRATLAWESRGFSPWITVGLDQRFDSTTRSTFNAGQSIDTSFGGWTAHAALSPIRWPGKGHYFLRPAWLFEVGQLTSSPTNPQNVAPLPAQNRRWLASGAGISAEARMVAPLAAVADLGLLFPFHKWQYYYTTATGESHPFDVPSVGLSARLGLILKFE